MLCLFCSEEIAEGAIKCKHCGEILDKERHDALKDPQSAPSQPSNNDRARGYRSYESLTPEQRESIMSYKVYTDKNCLICGYTGLMGVKQVRIPWYASMWLIFPFGLLFVLLNMWFGIAFAFVMMLVRHQDKKVKAECPSCKTIISTVKLV